MTCARIGLYGAMVHQKMNLVRKYQGTSSKKFSIADLTIYRNEQISFFPNMNIISEHFHRLPDQVPEEEDPVPPQHPDPDETPVPDHNPSSSVRLVSRKYFRRVSW
jgi:hypothetical protein